MSDNDGVTAGPDDVSNFLGMIRGSNQQSNERAGKTALEIIAVTLAAMFMNRKRKNTQ